jgi:beta-lactamase regulating signal transducer with metallopeptidase domain
MNILQMSITGGLLITVIIIIRAIALNKLPKKMFPILWSIVIFRLLVPVSIPLPFNVLSIYDVLFPATIEQPVIENPLNTGTTFPIIMPEVVGQSPETTQPFSVATVIWLFGMLAAFIFFAVIFFKNHRELRFATLIRDNDYLNKWLAEHKTKRSLSILQSDRITTPIAVGIFNPRIILPMSMNMDDTQLLDYVLAHEYYHIKQHDALLKILFTFTLCVHWFNPLVWVMFILANRDLELSCDEMVINRFGAETKTAYAYTLIGMAEQRNKFTPLYNSFSKNATEERIVSIMKVKKTSLVSLISACFMVSVLIVGAFAVSANDNTPSNPAPTTLALNNPPQNEDSVSHNEGELNFSLNNASTLDGINIIVNPSYWGSEIFDESGNVREGLDITWDFREVSEETYNKATQDFQNIPLPTYSDEQLAQITTDIESGLLQPINLADLPQGVEVSFFDGENTINIR